MPKYRSKLEDRLVSYALAVSKHYKGDRVFGLALQNVAKSALTFVGAASALQDACLIAAKAPSEKPQDKTMLNRTDYVFNTIACQLQEELEYGLSDLLEFLVVIGIKCCPDKEHSDHIRQWADGLDVCTEDLAVTDDRTCEKNAE